MEHLNQQQQYTMIAQFYASHIDKGKPFTVHHFCDSGVNKRKVYRVIGQYEKGEAMSRKTGSGRKALKTRHFLNNSNYVANYIRGALKHNLKILVSQL